MAGTQRSASDASGRLVLATLAEQVEEAIRLDIVTGVLRPGQWLRAAEISQQYGVSATPLREALQRLAAQNLIELGPRLGATVAPISTAELHDIYSLREVLDQLALARSIQRGDDAWRANLQAAFDRFAAAIRTGDQSRDGTREEALAWAAAHRAFHDALLAACDSPWLLRFVDVLSDHSERYRMLSMRSNKRHSLQEHQELLTHTLNQDTDRALESLRQHLHNTVAVLDNALPLSDTDAD